MRKTDNPKLTTSYKIQQSVLNNDEPSEDQVQKIGSFFFARWLSGNRYTTPIAAVINRYHKIPIRAQYIFARDYIKLAGLKGRVKFIGYPTDEKLQPEYKKLTENIQRYYNVNAARSAEYFDLMDNKERDRFYNMYQEGIQK